jgi:membrane protease YdiL (CAAX protease family)
VHNQSTVKQTPLQKVMQFFLTKMIVGIGVVVMLVTFIEWLRSAVLDKTNLSYDVKELIAAIAEATIATAAYILLFRWYEKRRIDELGAASFGRNALIGLLTGILLQSLFIFIIYLGGTFLVTKVNAASVLVSPFAFALTAGFVAEIIMIGIAFRLLEQQTGTLPALLVFVILFGIMHINVKGATAISAGATAMQAGLMIPAAYLYSRSLWLPVFLHLGWDFAEPGIFGSINPSTSLKQGLLTSKISGNVLITGGQTGPQDSLSALLLCLLMGLLFLWLAKRKANLVKPHWGTIATNKSIATSRAGH